MIPLVVNSDQKEIVPFEATNLYENNLDFQKDILPINISISEAINIIQASGIKNDKIKVNIFHELKMIKICKIECFREREDRWKCDITFIFLKNSMIKSRDGNSKESALSAVCSDISLLIESYKHIEQKQKITNEEIIISEFFGNVIICKHTNSCGFEEGLYFYEKTPPNILPNSIKKITFLSEASKISRDPWLYMLVVFGNDLPFRNKTSYYLIFADESNINFIRFLNIIKEIYNI